MSTGDDRDDQTPPPMLLDPARAEDPSAREWANREVYYVTKIARLEAEVGKLTVRCSKLALEALSLRRRLSTTKKETKEVK